MLGTHENLAIYSVFASFQSDKKAHVTEIATRNAVVPALSPEALPMGTQNREKNQDRRAMKRVGGTGATPGKLKL